MSDANKDEAFKCISLGVKYLKEGSKEKALKFFRKSDCLFPTDEAKEHIKNILEDSIGPDETLNDSTPEPSYTSSPTSSHDEDIMNGRTNENTARRRKGNSTGANMGEFTAEQLEAVKELKRRGTNHYAILGLKSDANDAAIKKAYRKLALQFHPDKNKAPGAIEGFKLIGKAFKVLSDPTTRRTYDLQGDEGVERNNRNGGFPTDDFNAFTAEEMFQMFFSGIHPNDIKRSRDRSRKDKAGQSHGQHPLNNNTTALINMVPMLLFLIVSMLSIWLEAPPAFNLTKTSEFPFARSTYSRGVPYYVRVEKEEFDQSYPTVNHIRQLDDSVDRYYIGVLQDNCRREKHYRDMEIQRAYSWR
eukprot:Ihof_evm1s954 gene=Ihof_evmTU1s954